MVNLINKKTGEPLGTITEDQLQFLVDQLEEEYKDDHRQDRDYSITSILLDYFVERQADPELILLLREALGEHDEVIIEWSYS